MDPYYYLPSNIRIVMRTAEARRDAALSEVQEAAAWIGYYSWHYQYEMDCFRPEFAASYVEPLAASKKALENATNALATLQSDIAKLWLNDHETAARLENNWHAEWLEENRGEREAEEAAELETEIEASAPAFQAARRAARRGDALAEQLASL